MIAYIEDERIIDDLHDALRLLDALDPEKTLKIRDLIEDAIEGIRDLDDIEVDEDDT